MSAQYQLTYVGKQPVDQVRTYVFDVSPRHMEKDQRYFSGRIWVDATDFQIVVTNGKNIPDDTRRGQEDLSIPFTTYRQQIDGKYWFPVYTRAEGVLHFKNCKKCLPERCPSERNREVWGLQTLWVHVSALRMKGWIARSDCRSHGAVR